MNPADSEWLNIWTLIAIVGCIIVFIGVAFEVVELLDTFGKELKTRRWVAKQFSKRIRTKLVLLSKYVKPKLFWPFEILGFALLFCGLALETLGGCEADRMQSKENITLESTNILLSNQIEKLRKANNEAADKVEQLRIKNNEIAAELHTKTDQLDNSIKKNVLFEEALFPRQFIYDDSTISGLWQYRGTQFAVIVAKTNTNDIETINFKNNVISTLSSSGWMNMSASEPLDASPGDGVRVWISIGTPLPGDAYKFIKATDDLVKDLKASHIVTSEILKRNIPWSPVIFIEIGKKPGV